jgi:peroxiredoxin
MLEEVKGKKAGAPKLDQKSLETAIAELDGWRLFAEGKFKEAAETLAKCPAVSKSHLATVYAHAGDAKAIALAAEGVDKGPGEVEPLAAQVEVLARLGKKEDARRAMDQLRTTAGKADRDLPRLRRLAGFARQCGLPDDWRTPAAPAKDLGARPTLDSLGPQFWKPFDAPQFSLESFDGKQASLSQHRGKPVLVLFYLGFGCAHCVEQLQKFTPATARFEKLGISLLAVSTESSSGLRAAGSKEGTRFPFPLLADPSLEVFKAYRAYDDFESTPLHGAFLIDGAGRVRWHEVGPEPFTDVDFLLGEAKRLLSLSSH